MWIAAVLAIMLSFIGYYSMVIQENLLARSQTSVTSNLANGMATYRQAVVNYYAANTSTPSGIKIELTQLINAGVIPYWAYQAPGIVMNSISQWDNYADSNGTIYIFTQSGLSTSVTADIVALSQNSILAGEAVSVGGIPSFFSPTYSTSPGLSPGIMQSLPPSANIPVGSPVWLASRI